MPDDLTEVMLLRLVCSLPLSRRMDLLHDVIIATGRDCGLDSEATVQRLCKKTLELMRQEEATTLGHALLLVSAHLDALQLEFEQVEQEARR